ncbi:GntR family transcriptional regulator [Rubinisphaera margarita]|uniref:GntR family transcriptional regulator n=1 Tax=Rubinisphaera margarita TaxID=2909586 RepID=UPI001EE980CB|nr:GntR family transcriptional regulator [Rubinisphaera margarita]MCG6155134.1 GntR family transcriptional regulator [Rubinisphaera margarita]
MFPVIDPQNGIPIFEQVCRQVKFAIADKAYLPGELLPSVREMAQKMAVNPNTVARSYGELQREGIIESVRGTGMQIATDATQLCQKERKRLIQERIASVLQEAKASQISRDDVNRFIEREMNRLWKNPQ